MEKDVERINYELLARKEIDDFVQGLLHKTDENYS